MTTAKVLPINLSNQGQIESILRQFTQVVAQVSKQPESPPSRRQVRAATVASSSQNGIIKTRAQNGGSVDCLCAEIDPSQKDDLLIEIGAFNKTLSGPHEHVLLVFEN